MGLEWQYYDGDEKCGHGRQVAEDDDPCPYDGARYVEDSKGETLVLCGQHHQKFIGAMAARRMVR
ncbi:hypothetical protein HRTV-14_gp107 [Halorubrum phage HRTV-14]|uniref:Uncharacterized protein n=1 Tax=Halorubrum phage HRTV-14 TaxID=2877994 RepID=A0AAE9BUE1_9CAUD|nr:hypothetical protein HRTV-14_gp107 [Halorubrum phage HRTV-14]